MTKKLVSLFLAALMLLGMMATVSAEESLYPLVKEPITITGVHFADNFDTETPRILWTEIEKLTGIKVEWIAIPTEQKNVYLSAGDWPDFFHSGINATVAAEYGMMAGMLVNLNDYAEYMPNMQALLDEYKGSRAIVTSADGGMYQLPRFTDSTTDANCRWHYNAALLKKAGVEVPTTVDEYYDVLVAIKEMTGAAPIADNLVPRHGFQNTAQGEWFLYAAFGTSTNPNFEDAGDGTVIYNRNSDQYRRYLQFMNKLYAEGLLHEEYMTLDGTTKIALITEGKTAFGADGWSNVSDITNFDGDWTNLKQLAPLTSEWDDTQVVAAYPHGKGSGAAINANSKYVKEICQMLDILYAKEEVAPGTGLYGEAGTYGPEGITWEFSNEEKTEWDYILPEGYNEPGTVYQWSDVIISNSIGAHIAQAKAFNGAMGNGRARQMSYVADLIPYQEPMQFPANQMAFNEEETEVVNLYETAIRAYVDEWNAWFVVGSKDPNNDADWNEYVAGFEAMGLTELIAAYQSAYVRYLEII